MDFKTSAIVLNLVILIGIMDFVGSQMLPDVIRLYKNKTTDYQKEVFPTWDQSKLLELTLQTYPLVINSFSETEETISMTMGVNILWWDPRLMWNPALFGNSTFLTITSEDVWIPFVYLSNSIDSLRPLGEDSQFYVTVFYSGVVSWTPGGVLKAKCPANTLKFPFDTQTCLFHFDVWSISKETVKCISDSDEGILSYFTHNSDWTIVEQSQYVIEVDQTSTFVFELSIKRHPLYYIIIVISPTFMFSLMNPLVFILPVESGERVSLGMTILLSYAIFLVLVTSSIPASSNPICALLLVMIIIMMISGLIVICVIISVYYYYIEDINGVNFCLRRLVFCCVCTKSKRNMLADKLNTENSISGKDVTSGLDTLFLIISYSLLVIVLSGYFIFIFIA